jgi:peroxiredoxin
VRSLVKNLRDKPFALLGVNIAPYDPEKLKAVMDKEDLNWRSFADGLAISMQRNAATPVYYVIDPQGVIRHKWVGNPGERAIDAALHKLIQEAEGN